MTDGPRTHRGDKRMSSRRTVFVKGIGRALGAGATLAELEADIQRARTLGAPDDAIVSRAVPGSVYAAEVVWVSEGETDD